MLYLENSLEESKKYIQKKIKKLNIDNLKNVELFYNNILDTVNAVKDKRLNQYIYENKKIKDIFKFNMISKEDFKSNYSTSIDLLYVSNFNSFNVNKIISVLTVDNLVNIPVREVNDTLSKIEVERYLKDLESISNDFTIVNKSDLKFDCGEEVNLDINGIELKDNVKALVIYHENNLITPNSTRDKYLKKPQFEILYIK